MTEEPNGRIELHGYQLAEINDKLKSIDSKLDKALPKLDVLEVRLSGLECWRGQATIVGIGVVMALLGAILKLVM